MIRKVTADELQQRRAQQAAEQAERRRFRQRYNPDALVAMIQRLTRLTLADQVRADQLSDDDLTALAALFPPYEIGRDYAAGDVFEWRDQLYEVLQDHTSQADWPPDTTASLYTAHAPAGVIPEWVQPTGAHDAYDTGDQATYQGTVYTSQIDGNTTVPGSDERWWVAV